MRFKLFSIILFNKDQNFFLSNQADVPKDIREQSSQRDDPKRDRHRRLQVHPQQRRPACRHRRTSRPFDVHDSNGDNQRLPRPLRALHVLLQIRPVVHRAKLPQQQ